MKRQLLIPALAALLPMVACADSGEDAREKGQQLLKPFKQSLMGALKQGLQEGPEAAVEVCHLQAPGIAEDAAPAGVKIGRTSHKVRNPDNRATDWQRKMVDYYLSHEDRQPRTRTLEDGRVAYVEPIELQPMCVMCHGANEQIPDAVQVRLDELYPGDEATGFKAGDFRGIFWVTWPADQTDKG